MSHSRWLALACALAPLAVSAAPDNQIHQLRQEIAALQLDHALSLTQAQAQSLLPLIQGVRAQVAALKAERASTQAALASALSQAVSDLKASSTTSASTAAAVQAARGRSVGTLRQDIKSFWQQAQPIFTSEQLEALKTVKLGIAPQQTQGGTPASVPRHAFAHRFRVMHTLLSDSFVSLLEARAG